jgi:hypothetical protein
LNLRFSFRPEPGHCFPLTIQVGLHIGEFFDDRLDPVPEFGASHILVNQLHLRCLPLLGLPSTRELDQGLAKRNGKRDNKGKVRDPNAVNVTERVDLFGQRF